MTFKIGDMVQWSSQAQGSTAKKVGEVVEVVTTGQRPDRERFEKLYRNSGCGYGRPERSYVVMVGNKPYWPRTSLLSLQGPSELERVKEKLARALSSLRSFDPKLADHIEGLK